ncbi:MAG: hypothetical protein R2737_11625 [Candidatus Nanopelagicales bacterium]
MRTRILRGDGGAALAVALMVILVVSMMAIIALGVILAQARTSVFTGQNAEALQAAEGGLDVATSTFKQAVAEASSKEGDLRFLPCEILVQTDYGPMTVQVSYFDGTPSAPGDEIPCADNLGPLSTPEYAVLQASALRTVDLGTIGRELTTTFTFQVRDLSNIPGGLIQNYPGGEGALCFDVGTTWPPVAGTRVTMQDCLDESDPAVKRQKFSYRPDYRISVSNTETSQGVGGMCLTATNPGTSSTSYVTLQPCDIPPAGATSTWRGRSDQLWSYNDVAQFQGEYPGSASAPTGQGNWCMVFQSYDLSGIISEGSYLVASTRSVCGQGYQSQWTWKPDDNVGAAAAGNPDLLVTATDLVRMQVVNYAEFGRCFDITSQNINSTFMIAFPCKQDPTPGASIAFNQLLTYEPVNATQGRLTTTNNSGVKVCLQARTGGGYVTTPGCTTGTNQLWTVNRDTGNALVDYTIVANDGRCLGLGPPGSTTAPLNQWSTIVTEACDPNPEPFGARDQKWNAPPGLARGGRGPTIELVP